MHYVCGKISMTSPSLLAVASGKIAMTSTSLLATANTLDFIQLPLFPIPVQNQNVCGHTHTHTHTKTLTDSYFLVWRGIAYSGTSDKGPSEKGTTSQ